MANLTQARSVVGIAAALLLGACSSSNEPDLPPPAAPPGPPAPPAQVTFTSFVKLQFAQTADNTDPVDVESQELTFTDSTNAAAYDDLLDPK